MPMYIKVSGAWKEISAPYIKVSGAWKAVQNGYIKVSGAWKEFYTAISATLSNDTIFDTAISPSDAAAGIKVDSDGYIYNLVGSTYTQQYQWKLAGNSTDFESRWTNTSGTLSSGTAGVWNSCGSDTGYNRNNTTNGNSTNTCVGTLEIRLAAAPNTVLASATITLEAVVEI